jgi:hypothetical protein
MESTPSAPRPKQGRSSISNGTRLFSTLEGLDGRCQTLRRFRDLVESISLDLGGVDYLSDLEKQLVRRAAGLSAMAESIEADLVRERPFDLAAYGLISDRLRRIAESLGLKRVARDATPKLSDYLQARTELDGEASE